VAYKSVWAEASRVPVYDARLVPNNNRSRAVTTVLIRWEPQGPCGLAHGGPISFGYLFLVRTKEQYQIPYVYFPGLRPTQ